MVLDPLNDASIVLGSHQFREGAQHADSHGLDDHELARTFGAYPIKYELLESHLRMPIRDDQRRSLAQPSHCLQPLNFEDFPPDDGIATVESMSSFISAFRGYASRLVAQGVSPDDILGPVGLDVQALFKKDDFRQARTVSTFVPRFVANFDLLGLKEKLAFSVTINLVLRVRITLFLRTFPGQARLSRAFSCDSGNSSQTLRRTTLCPTGSARPQRNASSPTSHPLTTSPGKLFPFPIR